MSLKCRKCGSVHPDQLETMWGRTRETQAYGGEPKCITLVIDPRTGVGQVCAGRLTDSDAEPTQRLTSLEGAVIHEPATADATTTEV